VQLVSKISNLCDPDPPTLQTDGRTDRRTDGQHAISIPRYALVHRAVIKISEWGYKGHDLCAFALHVILTAPSVLSHGAHASC